MLYELTDEHVEIIRRYIHDDAIFGGDKVLEALLRPIDPFQPKGWQDDWQDEEERAEYIPVTPPTDAERAHFPELLPPSFPI